MFAIENFGRTLRFKQLNSTHEGQYECEAQNNLGSVRTAFAVTVGGMGHMKVLVEQ